MPLPSVTGTVCQTIAEDRLVESLANSTNCQTFLGAADVAEAKLRIHIDGFDEPADGEAYTDVEFAATFPSVLIYSEEYESHHVASRTKFVPNGVIVAEFERTVDPDWSSKVYEWQRLLKEDVGKIVEEMEAMRDDGSAARLGIRSSTMIAPPEGAIAGPYRYQHDRYPSLGDIEGVQYTFTWGIE